MDRSLRRRDKRRQRTEKIRCQVSGVRCQVSGKTLDTDFHVAPEACDLGPETFLYDYSVFSN